MNNGPILNDVRKKFNTRDPLGLQGVSQTIVGDLCPVINSVTPHAFYWILVNWVYYDLYENQKIKDTKQSTLDEYLKKINYFVILGNLFNNVDVPSMYGVQNIRKDITLNDTSFYTYNEDYVRTLTGVNYYKAALRSAGFITYNDEEGNEYQHLKFTINGKTLAESFDNLIKETRFHKEYIMKNNYDNVPYDVIKELGIIASFNMEKLQVSKELLKRYFFVDIKKLSKQAEFIKYLYYDLDIKNIDEEKLRDFFYDYFSPRSLNNKCNKDLDEILRGWEVLIARHYFTNALEMVFTFSLEKLTRPMHLSEFLNIILKNIDLNISFKEFINDNSLNGKEIQELLIIGKNKKTSHENNIINSLKILCSLYNRLSNRDDINRNYLLFDNDGLSISLNDMINDIDNYKEKNIKEYLVYMIDKYIIKQHIITSQRKFMLKEDCYYFAIDNNYIYKTNREKKEFVYGLQNLRINQLFQVMKELDMLGDE